MSLIFTPEFHKYESIGGEDIDWVGVTSFVSFFKQPFDPITQSIKSSKNKKSQWFGVPPEDIRKIWRGEGDRSIDLGHWYHNQRESDITEFSTIERNGITLPIIRPIIKDGIKYAPVQELSNGVYPEHLVYLKSIGLCGQSDRVEIINGIVSISDYKTNKEIKFNGYTNWEGSTQMLTEPLSHLEDCHIVHYGLQLSLYLYIILKHNPTFTPGSLTIDHIIFEEEGKDKYGYPIYKKDSNGNTILKELRYYKVPYYKDEVITMIKFLKDNRQLIKSKYENSKK